MSVTQAQFAAYVNAAADLAESVRADIADNNGHVTDDTVQKLATFIYAAKAVQGFLNLHTADGGETLQ